MNKKIQLWLHGEWRQTMGSIIKMDWGERTLRRRNPDIVGYDAYSPVKTKR